MKCNTCKRKLYSYFTHTIVEQIKNAGSMVKHICTGCYVKELEGNI